jgi:LysM repeat protein
MTTLRRTTTLLRAISAALVLVALVVGVPFLLVATVGNPIPDYWRWNRPLTTDAILGVLAGVAWLFWVQVSVCVLVELVAEIRIATGRSADWLNRIPGTFGGQQAVARTLIQAVVAVGLTTTTTATGWAPRAEAAASTPIPQTAPTPPTAAAPPSTIPHDPQPVTRTQLAQMTCVTVEKGDTLWSIAETHLGSGERWREIAELNDGRTMSDGTRFHDAGTILPGWELLIPTAKGTADHRGIAVRPGDSLWKIAEREYGDGSLWPRIYAANDSTIETPNLIHPGQPLVIPGAPPEARSQDQGPAPEPPRHSSATEPRHQSSTEPIGPRDPEQPPPLQPSVAPTTEPTPDSTATPTPAAHADDRHASVEETLLRALLGGGGLLAAGMLTVYLGRRRTQYHDRRSGRMVPRTAPDLVEAETSVRIAAAESSEGGPAVDFIDRALRELAQSAESLGFALPDVRAARVDADRLDLHLTVPASDPPEPWLASTDDAVWSISRLHDPAPSERVPPYPTLVTLGTDDAGGTWLVDLESAGLVQITGDTVVGTDVLRFIAAQLALCPWADTEDVTLTGFGEELVTINYGRLTHDPTLRIQDLAKSARHMAEIQAHGTDVLATRVNAGGGNGWMPMVLLATLEAEDTVAAADTAAYVEEAARIRGRSATALVLATPSSLTDGGLSLTAHRDGSLSTPWATLEANRLGAEDAVTLREMFADADTEGDEPIPPATHPDGTSGSTDQAGALVPELTEERCGTGDPESLLPLPDERYLAAAATTEADLAALAPAVPSSERTKMIAADPTLDADLADWADPACPRPKLRVIGPVELHAAGEQTNGVQRRPAYFAELAAYLACRPDGATPDQMATAFGLQHNSLHSRVGELRKWLGTKSGSDAEYLPNSMATQARRTRGHAVYQLDGLLCDADLFRRLRARGEARGPHGIDDLRYALELVAGEPFAQQRTGRYAWLVETPLDHFLTAAIVDVAHVLATHGLANQDPRLAAWAAERAISAVPADDKPRLDLSRAMEALGDPEGAQRYLARQVSNRSDDDRAPLDPSARTKQVLDQRDHRRR